MAAVVTNAATFVLGFVEGGGGEEESSTFLVSPDVGLMLWTLLSFFVALYVLRKYAFPKITEALDKRQHAIEDSIDTANRTKAEADELLAEYRERLKEARVQAEEIVTRARAAGASTERESVEAARVKREELMAQARKDIEAETRRAIGEIRNEVADLTVAATEKVTRKTLTAEDQKRLVDEALGELDFTALSGERR
ncbi:MAG: atpF [Solirubrobacterales bacterium]|jgi:F-type H+-transporting ATPase subunit b|nr:atpF [Solirubrobacterales bacterium]